MRRPSFLAVTIAVASLGTQSFAAKARGIEVPPSKYSLSEVSFELWEGGSQGSTSVRFDGTGRGTVKTTWLMRGDTTETFGVEPAKVFELLQLCYREGFFALQSTYGPPPSIRLGADGTIESITTVVADASGTSLTVRLGSYTKSVGYLKGLVKPPSVVTELERRIDELRTTGSRSAGNGGRSSNYQIKPPVVPVTRLASARRAPVPPAAYLVRWADPETRKRTG